MWPLDFAFSRFSQVTTDHGALSLLTLGKIICATSEVSFCAETYEQHFGEVGCEGANLFGA